MITAVDIFEEVEADVGALNGEVIRRAFHGHCCEFFNRQEEFAVLLKRYVDLRILLHRLRIHECRSGVQNVTDIAWADYTKTEKSRRQQLNKIWPCAACVWLYNPTNKIKRFPRLINPERKHNHGR